MSEKEFIRLAKEFDGLRKILSNKGDFKSMQYATVCAGLSEVCEMLAKKEKVKL